MGKKTKSIPRGNKKDSIWQDPPVVAALIGAVAIIAVAVITLATPFVERIANESIPIPTNMPSPTAALVSPITETLTPLSTTPSPTGDSSNSLMPTEIPCRIWEFNEDGDLQGWYVWKRIKNLKVDNGTIKGDVTQFDPGLLSPQQLKIDTSIYKILKIRYLITAEDVLAQIHWYTENNENFEGGNFIDFGIVADGEWHTGEIHLDSRASWTDSKTVMVFRLDPVKNADSGTFEYDYIQLCP